MQQCKMCMDDGANIEYAAGQNLNMQWDEIQMHVGATTFEYTMRQNLNAWYIEIQIRNRATFEYVIGRNLNMGYVET